MKGKQFLSRASLYVGIVLLAFGIVATASILFEIPLTQNLCEGGLSPVPAQGCGYIPQLVLFVWGYYPALVYGLYSIYAGCAVLLVRWLAQVWPRIDKKPPPNETS
jgi:hypothetical protein